MFGWSLCSPRGSPPAREDRGRHRAKRPPHRPSGEAAHRDAHQSAGPSGFQAHGSRFCGSGSAPKTLLMQWSILVCVVLQRVDVANSSGTQVLLSARANAAYGAFTGPQLSICTAPHSPAPGSHKAGHLLSKRKKKENRTPGFTLLQYSTAPSVFPMLPFCTLHTTRSRNSGKQAAAVLCLQSTIYTYRAIKISLINNTSARKR